MKYGTQKLQAFTISLLLKMMTLLTFILMFQVNGVVKVVVGVLVMVILVVFVPLKRGGITKSLGENFGNLNNP